MPCSAPQFRRLVHVSQTRASARELRDLDFVALHLVGEQYGGVVLRGVAAAIVLGTRPGIPSLYGLRSGARGLWVSRLWVPVLKRIAAFNPEAPFVVRDVMLRIAAAGGPTPETATWPVSALLTIGPLHEVAASL